MKIVVITGSTKGIGLGLARAFLELGCAVMVSSRHQQAVDEAVALLSAEHDAARVAGAVCDVAVDQQVQALWAAAVARFGCVDLWINNAGRSHPQAPLWQQPGAEVQSVIDTNLLGTINGCQVALLGMGAQGHGALYNMEGLGSDGRTAPGLTLYGTTKYAIRYLTESLVKETRGGPVIVGALSPGMVLTDLLVGDQARQAADWTRARRLFNILADRVETVTPWLARKALMNRRHGARIMWLTPAKAAWRFASAPFARRDLFEEEG